jgi:hypothetical protein
MNFVLDFFNPNNSEEDKRDKWVNAQIDGGDSPNAVGWIKQAQAFTSEN